MQPVGSEAGNTCTLHRTRPSSCAGTSKVQLQPESAAAAAAAATATTTSLRTHAAAQAAMSAFVAAAAAQAAQSAKATNRKPVYSRLRQAPAMAQAATPGSTCAATLLAQQSKLLDQLYHRGECGQRSHASSAMPNAASTSDASGCSSASSDNSSRSAMNGRSTGYSSGGCLPGAAYFLIPQPAYHDDHLIPQTRSIPKRSGTASNGMCTAGRAPIAAARERTVQPEWKQVSKRGSANAADKMMMRPDSTVQSAAFKRRCVGGPRGSSFRPESLHKAGIEPRQERPGFAGDGGDAGNGDSGDVQDDPSMSAEARLERSREQNRQSSKKARMRRKGEEESLVEQIRDIQAFRLMVEEGPDMMSIHDLDHRAPFRFASSAFQRIAGIDPRNILGRGLTDLIAVEDHVVVQQTLLKVVFSQASGNVVAYRMLTPGGECLRVETSIRAGDQCIICVARVVSRNQSPLLQSPPHAVARDTSARCVGSGSGGGINDGDGVGGGGVSICASGSVDGRSDGGSGGSGSASSGSKATRSTKPGMNAGADAFATHYGNRVN